MEDYRTLNTDLKEICKDIRCDIMTCIGHLGVGHVGGCLSIVELLAVLYFEEMNIDPAQPKLPGRDRLVCSKGHAGPAVYATLANRGYFDKKELLTLNQGGTHLPSHCDMNRTPGVDMTTGSLGQGFSCAVGVAVGSRIRRDGANIFAIIGDGESQEGQIWEAAMYAAHAKLDNLIAFTDLNGFQIDGSTDEVNSLGDIAAKWRAFGWHTQEIDGHDHAAICEAIEAARREPCKPHMILLHTVKGRGVGFIERLGAANHNTTLNAEQTEAALAELG